MGLPRIIAKARNRANHFRYFARKVGLIKYAIKIGFDLAGQVRDSGGADCEIPLADLRKN